MRISDSLKPIFKVRNTSTFVLLDMASSRRVVFRTQSLPYAVPHFMRTGFTDAPTKRAKISYQERGKLCYRYLLRLHLQVKHWLDDDDFVSGLDEGHQTAQYSSSCPSCYCYLLINCQIPSKNRRELFCERRLEVISPLADLSWI